MHVVAFDVVAEDVDQRYVGLVARAGEVRDPDVLALCGLEHHRAERAALADQRHTARAEGSRVAQLGERGEHARWHVHQPDAVGPEDPHPVLPGERDQPLLQPCALDAGLGKARAVDEQRLHAELRRLLGDTENRFGADGDDRDVRRRREVGEPRDRGQALDRLVPGVHRNDVAVENGAQVRERAAVDGLRVVGGADDRDALRREQRVERVRRTCGGHDVSR